MTVWDWKFRIFFQTEVKNEVKEWMTKLKYEEYKIYENIVEFYSSFYSFGILFDLMSENVSEAKTYLTYAIESIDKIVQTPMALAPYYRQRIKSNFKDSQIQQQLLHLLDVSLKAHEVKFEYWCLVAELLGNSHEAITNIFLNDQFDSTPYKRPAQRIIHRETQATFEKMYLFATTDTTLNKRFGNNAIKNFGKKITVGNGYGEWWDRDISATGHDELVLYTNDNEVKREDYFYTIIHETYPGHGHFYNFVCHNNTLMDHGAMMLTEGWATYCEWNTFPSKYVDVVKHNALVFLNNSYLLDCNTRANLIYERKRKQGLKVSQFITSLIYATQYIGYLEAYYLGALWIEKAIAEKYHSPVEFLSMLNKSNKGEFFKLWL